MSGGPETLLPGLTAWKIPEHLHQMFGTKNFKIFFPNYGDLAVGKPYYIIKSNSQFLSQNRHSPNWPEPHEALVFSLLSMFHRNTFVIGRFGPQGSVGVIRAMNNKTVDIMFR